MEFELFRLGRAGEHSKTLYDAPPTFYHALDTLCDTLWCSETFYDALRRSAKTPSCSTNTRWCSTMLYKHAMMLDTAVQRSTNTPWCSANVYKHFMMLNRAPQSMMLHNASQYTTNPLQMNWEALLRISHTSTPQYKTLRCSTKFFIDFVHTIRRFAILHDAVYNGLQRFTLIEHGPKPQLLVANMIPSGNCLGTSQESSKNLLGTFHHGSSMPNVKP